MAKKKKSKLKTYLISAARRLSRYHPAKAQALKAARCPDGRIMCVKCGRKFLDSNIQWDHIVQVRATKEDMPVADWENGIFKNWDKYYLGLFCKASNYQALCIACHLDKTLADNAAKKAKK